MQTLNALAWDGRECRQVRAMAWPDPWGYGTVGTVDGSGLSPGFADLTWNPELAVVGNSHMRILYD